MFSGPARFVAAAAAVVVIGIVGFAILGRGGPSAGGTATGSPSASPVETGSATPSPQPSQEPNPTPVTTPLAERCDPIDLAARITLWTGATGHRIATVEVTNIGSAPCDLDGLDRPQLIDGPGAVLIDGVVPAESAVLTLAPGDVLRTLVQDGNYCGPAPIAPVTVAFVYPDGSGRFVATPVSPTDLDGVPPCSGPAGSAGSIEMHPWGSE